MYLSSYSFIEPEEPFFLYYPSWLNVWESHSYNNALKSTGANSWAFKRFGSSEAVYSREITRRPEHIPYINALDKVSDTALHELSAKECMLLLKSRTAFVYIDSWGESGIFECNISSLHLSAIDTLPRNLIKKFSVTDVTCKIRGESNSLVLAMRLAQDYLAWNIFDFVVICGGYRTVPLLSFTAENINLDERKKEERLTPHINLSIERVGCFIFSQRGSDLRINCGPYINSNINEVLEQGYCTTHDIDQIAYAGGINQISNSPGNVIELLNIYGYSGCMTPALIWQYIFHRSLNSSCTRTIIPCNPGGYTYFDTFFEEEELK
ncbi:MULTISPECIES: ATP-binding protein [unclassified Klebsiella]|uniref:ATP-binding protein n=1 Tax=unclassified Klebsiella TaxID=2608929 RepID=UPI001D1913D0|nr:MULTISPECIES: ATP-binding protein [unclassified Klebsiella]